MEDTRPREQGDDAPLTAWKEGDSAAQATQSLIEPYARLDARA